MIYVLYNRVCVCYIYTDYALLSGWDTFFFPLMFRQNFDISKPSQERYAVYFVIQ